MNGHREDTWDTALANSRDWDEDDLDLAFLVTAGKARSPPTSPLAPRGMWILQSSLGAGTLLVLAGRGAARILSRASGTETLSIFARVSRMRIGRERTRGG